VLACRPKEGTGERGCTTGVSGKKRRKPFSVPFFEWSGKNISEISDFNKPLMFHERGNPPPTLRLGRPAAPHKMRPEHPSGHSLTPPATPIPTPGALPQQATPLLSFSLYVVHHHARLLPCERLSARCHARQRLCQYALPRSHHLTSLCVPCSSADVHVCLHVCLQPWLLSTRPSITRRSRTSTSSS